MLKKPPYMPTGIKTGTISDDDRKLGVLTFETAEGDIDFAVNLQAVDVLNRAINTIEQELRSHRAAAH
ncbi:hypothetical protein [Mesorhizobium kowhaii]|uniref:Uncharacterized protein n=1 Tax=Mesorhizobium kowhaii TaxID=1300272 RepID=A0A2W7CAC3_9HYPH|nr:hypothetical protein [Mesorhizobium kowhaii]PZV39957.1 hypothetical protein B5V02_02965 [Mesorhizobium kowhaii]